MAKFGSLEQLISEVDQTANVVFYILLNLDSQRFGSNPDSRRLILSQVNQHDLEQVGFNLNYGRVIYHVMMASYKICYLLYLISMQDLSVIFL